MASTRATQLLIGVGATPNLEAMPTEEEQGVHEAPASANRMGEVFARRAITCLSACDRPLRQRPNLS